ncbi:RNA polymerase sigma factor [Stenotrophomonas rhizophila]
MQLIHAPQTEARTLSSPIMDDPQQVLAEHWPMLSRIAASFAHDLVHRQDLLQDISIAVWHALPRWRGEGSQRAFVARVAHNRAIDVLAREQRLPTASLEEALPDPLADPVRHAESDQQRQALLIAVRRLPLGYRQVVSLSLEGFSQREIAQVLGMEENAVAQRLSRARRQLRDWMGATR